jgi:hypothetical protein
MNKQQPYYWLMVLLVCLTLGLSGWSTSSAQETEPEEAAIPVEFERVIELDREVHFLTPKGEDVLVSPGAYTVETADGGLQLIPSGEEPAEVLIIAAKSTRHEKSVDSPEPMSMSGEEDQHVVMLLMPEGKALQAVGSYSGVHTRGFKLKPGFLSGLKGMALPTVKSILTISPGKKDFNESPTIYPPPGHLTPGGMLYIKGSHFGTKGSKSKVILHLTIPTYSKKYKVPLSVQKWTNTKISAKIPLSISGVKDQKAKFQILNAKGVGGIAKRVPFYATRQGVKLTQSDPVIKVKHCSPGGDKNYCNGVNASTGGSCFQTSLKNFKAWGSIYARHVNCDHAIDWDDGMDRYAITLKNKWVFTRVSFTDHKSSGSEKVKPLPDHGTLRKIIPGQSSWEPIISWKVSPGPDQLEYMWEIWIKGPKGVPYY